MFILIPHGICLSSSPQVIALIVASNIGIVVAYLAMPIIFAILLFRYRIRLRIVLTLCCAFITGCGASHVMDIVTMYAGGNWYWVQAVTLAFTAVMSLTTAAVMLDLVLRPNFWISQNGQSS